jgi:hypothetical protein
MDGTREHIRQMERGEEEHIPFFAFWRVLSRHLYS